MIFDNGSHDDDLARQSEARLRKLDAAAEEFLGGARKPITTRPRMFIETMQGQLFERCHECKGTGMLNATISCCDCDGTGRIPR